MLSLRYINQGTQGEPLADSKSPIRECVYDAYREHLSDIISDDLPEEIQIVYESVTDRFTSVEPLGDIGTDEAGCLAKDILYMADKVQAHYKKP